MIFFFLFGFQLHYSPGHPSAPSPMEIINIERNATDMSSNAIQAFKTLCFKWKIIEKTIKHKKIQWKITLSPRNTIKNNENHQTLLHCNDRDLHPMLFSRAPCHGYLLQNINPIIDYKYKKIHAHRHLT